MDALDEAIAHYKKTYGRHPLADNLYHELNALHFAFLFADKISWLNGVKASDVISLKRERAIDDFPDFILPNGRHCWDVPAITKSFRNALT